MGSGEKILKIDDTEVPNVDADSIVPWADVPNLSISCGYGHSETVDAAADKPKFDEYRRERKSLRLHDIYRWFSSTPKNYTAGAAAVQILPVECRSIQAKVVTSLNR